MTTVGTDLRIHGLQPEDAVLHFDTLDGRTIVQPSNRVCIYAPRFAAVRKVSGVQEQERHLRSWRLDGETIPVAADDLKIPTDVNQPVGTVRQVGTKLANELDERTRGVGLDNALRPVQEREGRVPHEDAVATVQDLLAETQEPETAELAQEALVWTLVQAVQMVIDGQPAMVEASYQSPNVVYQYKLDGKPRMRVIKSASTDMARPGDRIEFTIRVDNIGTQKVEHVTIVDNLSPRFEYISGSAQCSRQAEFSTEANKVESLILRWDIREPLLAGEGGVIRFDCLVR
jgi:uncharacterized repeat protein (TIGR01451 family)